VLLVTRPLAAGQRLSAQLRAEGVDALWWPAFDLLLEPDPAGGPEVWQALAGTGATPDGLEPAGTGAMPMLAIDGNAALPTSEDSEAA